MAAEGKGPARFAIEVLEDGVDAAAFRAAIGAGTGSGGGGNYFGTVAVSGQSDVVADADPDTLTLAAGANIAITTNAGTDTVTIAATGLAASSHTHAPSDITGTAVVTGDSRLSDARTPTAHTHAPSEITGTAVVTADSRLSDARTPTAHTHPASEVSDSTAAGRALLTAADASAQRTALALGTLATQSGTFSGTSSGTNTGDDATNSLYSGLVTNATHTGEVTGSGALTIANDAVTYAKMQNVSAISKLLGRGSAAGAGDVEEITLGTNLTMTGTTLDAAGGGGNSFGTIAVSGQTDVVADASNDTLTLVGSGITITTTPAADTITFTAVGGAVAGTTVEKDLGATATWRGRFTITDAGISGTSKVLCWQAPGPYTGKGTRADEAEMQPVSIVSVEPAAGSATVTWQTPPGYTQELLLPDGKRFSTAAALNEQMMFPTLIPRRIGKVRGNVKFTYLILT